MATSQQVQVLSVVSGAAVRLYRFITMNSSTGKFAEVGTAQSVRIDGICAEAVSASDKTMPMVIPNGCIAKVEAGAATTKGGLVASDNQGRAIDAVSGAGNWQAGEFMDAAGAAGEIVRIMFRKAQDEVT